MWQVLELDSNNTVAASTARRLTPIVEAKREAMKEEMMGARMRCTCFPACTNGPSAGKLKDLGNSILGRFGISLDNFKAVQDPATGSYSISYQQ